MPSAAPFPRPAAVALPGRWEALGHDLEGLERSSGATALAVAAYDLEAGRAFAHRADRWFHAASTVKLAYLAGVFSAMHRGALAWDARLHVRNRFASALDGEPFRVRPERDANHAVQASVGRTMRVSALSRHMIATSSNLAANLLLELVGTAEVHRAMERLGVEGIDVQRGVEDERAWAAGISNRVTAHGLVQLLRAVAEGEAFSPDLSRRMLDVLLTQEFKSGIPARLPRAVRVAHKTGEISTIAHDAGIVMPPGRKAYAVAVLTEWPADARGRSATIAAASRLVYDALTGEAATHG